MHKAIEINRANSRKEEIDRREGLCETRLREQTVYRTNTRPRNDLDLDEFPAANKVYGAKLERLRVSRPIKLTGEFSVFT